MPISRRPVASNPFDSDEEAEGQQHRKKTDYRKASNPFDDDNDHDDAARHHHSRHPANPPKLNQSNPKKPSQLNPFDDDDDDEAADRNRNGGIFPSSSSSSKNSSSSSDKTSLFDDDAARSEQRRKKERNKERLVTNPSPNLFKYKNDPKESNGMASHARKGDSEKTAIKGRGDLFSGDSREEPSSGFRFHDSDFRGHDALQYKSIEDLEGYSIQKSKETTNSVQNCLRVAEEIRSDATQTLLSLHEQGEKIKGTHEVAVDIDQNLSKGETLLGSLGGMFSRTWKPKKTRPITGPALSKNDSFKRRANHMEQRVALGINKGKSKDRAPINSNGQQSTQEILNMERKKQDDGLSDVSDILEELKGMSLDMGKEISSQMVYLNDLDKDVSTLNERIDGANRRARHLLRK